MMQDFFKLVLPEPGWKFVVTIKDGHATHHACSTFDEMEMIATAACAECIDAYFACASFAEPQYVDSMGQKRARTRANAVVAKSFWLDIDVGEGKPYASQADAILELGNFCVGYKLTKPMLVSSGAGLHCYWPMMEDVPKVDWQSTASKLKALTKHPAIPLTVDQSRTSDIASILRPIGTLNFKRKSEGEPVQLLKAFKPIAFQEFRSAVDAAYATIAPTIVRPNIGPRNRSGSNQADIVEVEDPLRHIDPDRGDRSDWWTPIAALADEFGEEARELARRWSRGDFKDAPSIRYDADDFDAQFDDCLARDDYDGDRASIGTIIWLARLAGWMGGTPAWVRDLNEEHAWIEKANAIYRLKFGDFAKPADFRQQFANQYVEVSGGDKLKHVPSGDAWLKHPARRQHDDLVMRPAEPPVTADNCLNVWQGFKVEPAQGDTAPFFELFRRLIPDADAGRYVQYWLAHLLQRPHVKMMSSLVIWSRMEGVGKNLLFECFKDIIGSRHATLIGQADLARDFNGWARDKILVIGDEVIGEDRRQHADKLKGLITGSTVQINEKHQPVVELENLANFIFLSNHPTAVFVGDDDRRYFVWEVEAEPMIAEEVTAFTSWRDGGGLPALLHHLLLLDISSFNPKARAPSTTAKRQMVNANRSDFEVWAEQVVSSGARNVLGREIATALELADCYRSATGARVSTKTVTTAFKKLGAYQREHQVRVGKVKLRPIAIDRPHHWRNEPEGSWAPELRKPLSPIGLPQQCLTTDSAQVVDFVGFTQNRGG